MLLAIDVGNTNTAFAVFVGEKLKGDWRASTQPDRTADEYASLLLPLLAERAIELSGVNACAISSVVPATIRHLVRFARKHLNCKTPFVLSAEMDLGLEINYRPKSDVGADRIANAVAAHNKYASKVIVVDFGTATTLDAISADGKYLGGAIAPGIEISLEALFARAAKLKGVELAAPERAIGDTTTGSLQSGIIFGFAGQVDALVTRFQDEMGGGAKVVATGGLAEVISAHSSTIDCCDDTLTLDGIRMIYERSARSAEL